MNDEREIKAAAERLRNQRDNYYLDDLGPLKNDLPKYLADLRIVANAYLVAFLSPALDAESFLGEFVNQYRKFPNLRARTIAEFVARLAPHLRPAVDTDDELPVDKDWLQSIGFDGNSGRFRCGRLEFTLFDGCWNSWWSFSDLRGSTRLIDDVKTRGHVRRLASALGIDLKPAT